LGISAWGPGSNGTVNRLEAASYQVRSWEPSSWALVGHIHYGVLVAGEGFGLPLLGEGCLDLHQLRPRKGTVSKLALGHKGNVVIPSDVCKHRLHTFLLRPCLGERSHVFEIPG
jgi:hypothetical protein